MSISQDQLQELKNLEIPMPELPKPSIIKVFLLKQVPFVRAILDSATNLGVSTDMLINLYITTSRAANSLRGLQIVGVGLSAIDLVTLPLAYISCRIAGQPFPFTLSRGIKTLFTAALFTLGVLALVFPLAGPIIALISLTAVVGAGIATVAKQFFTSRKVSAELTALNIKIRRLESIKQAAANPDITEEEFSALYQEKIKLLAHTSLSKLVNRKAELQTKLHALGMDEYVNKVSGIALAAISAIGVAVFFIIPPLGLFILSSAAATGLAFIAIRTFTAIISRKTKRSAPPLAVAEAPVQQNIKNNNKKILELPKQSLKKSLSTQVNLENKAECMIEKIQDTNAITEYTPLVIQFLINVGKVTLEKRYGPKEILSTLNELGFSNIGEKICHVLDDIQSGAIEIKREDMALLQKLEPVKKYLDEHPASPNAQSSEPADKLMGFFQEHYQPGSHH